MCGITGIFSFNNNTNIRKDILAMNNSIRHRGPDDEGYYFFSEDNSDAHCYGPDTITELKSQLQNIDISLNSQLALGFRRLSIIDLGPKGHQPMCDETGRYTVVFNGEIYNHLELRHELKKLKVEFHSSSDTEVLLKSYIKWGEKCVERFKGMWAFAIFDKLEKKLFCSRDRFGIKPFHYVNSQGKFYFASEIKALLHIIPFEEDKRSIYYYFSKGITCFDEHTFFKNIFSLKPGYNLVIKERKVSIYKYYDIPKLRTNIQFEEASIELKKKLITALELTQRSDTPLSYSLSGGIDSSSIVCLANALKQNKKDTLATFSMVFPGSIVDESEYIDEVTRFANCSSKKFSFNENDLANDIEKLCFSLEQPFGGLSYYGEYKLRETINKNNYKISVEGQGADEILTGYDNLIEFYLFDLLNDLKIIKFFREFNQLSQARNINLYNTLKNFIKTKLHRNNTEDLSKYSYVKAETFDEYKNTYKRNKSYKGSFLQEELYEQLTQTSIPEQLMKADKIAMAHSIEARFPFLDNDLVEYALNLSSEFKIKNGVSKFILRETLKNELPLKIYERKDKIGFSVPLDSLISARFWDEIMEQVKSSTIPYINISVFLHTYKDKTNIDWKFWKVVSLILWYNTYYNYSNSISRR